MYALTPRSYVKMFFSGTNRNYYLEKKFLRGTPRLATSKRPSKILKKFSKCFFVINFRFPCWGFNILTKRKKVRTLSYKSYKSCPGHPVYRHYENDREDDLAMSVRPSVNTFHIEGLELSEPKLAQIIFRTTSRSSLNMSPI